MNVFVTGHDGFIGSNLMSYLRSQGHNVKGCSKKSGCDLLGPSDLRPMFKGSELVFHLAAEAKPAESLLTPLETLENNARMTIKVALACRDMRIPMIYASSCEIYGDCNHLIDEETPLMPTNPYAASKLACDRILYSFYRCYHLDVKIARLFNPYGPHQQLNKIIPTFYQQARRNLPLTVYGDGNDTRDYVFVEDIVRGLWEAQRLEPGDAVNLATGTMTKSIEVARAIIRKLESSSTIALTPYPKIFGGIRYQGGSYEKAKKLLGWEPRFSLGFGLDRTISWLETLKN